MELYVGRTIRTFEQEEPPKSCTAAKVGQRVFLAVRMCSISCLVFHRLFESAFYSTEFDTAWKGVYLVLSYDQSFKSD